MRLKSFSLLTFLFCLIFSLPGFQKQEKSLSPLEHEVTVRLIVVDVIVLDNEENFVTDLTKKDFEIFEDGLSVPINSVELINLEKAEFLTQEKKESALPALLSREKRMFVIFDSINTIKRELKRSTPKIIEKLMSLIKLGYEIMIFELTPQRGMEVLQPFTRDETILARAVERVSGNIWVDKSQRDSAPVLEEAAGPGQAQAARGHAEKLSEMENISYGYFKRMRFESTMNGLLALMNMIKDYPGRKTILFISGGIPYEDPRSVSNAARIFDPFTLLNKRGVRKQHEILDALIHYANAHNITFYALDPDTCIKYIAFAGGSALFDPGDSERARDKLDSLHNLNWLAQDTGGISLKGAKRFENFYRAVKRDLSYYYELSFYPQRKRADGKYHKIEVHVNRPDVKVRFRQGYMDYPKAQKEILLISSASYNPSLFKQIPFEVQAVPFFRSEDKFILWMNFALPAEKLIKDGTEGVPSRNLRLSLLCRGPSYENFFTGQVNIPLNLDPAFLESIKRAGYFGYSCLTPELRLQKARYQVVFVLYDGKTEEIGAQEKLLINPHLKNSTRPQMLNVVLGTLAEEVEEGLKPFTLSRRDGALQLSKQKFYPSVMNQFKQGERAGVFVQIFSPQGGLEIGARFFLSQDGKKIRELSGEVVETLEERGTKIWNAGFSLNIDDITAGDYLLVVEVEILDAGSELSKEVPLRIKKE